MLAKTADQRVLSRLSHWLLDQKADGMRIDLVCEDHGLVVPYTRLGNTEPYTTNLTHITEAAAQVLTPGECLTGELLLGRSWNETMKVVRRKKLRPGDAEKMRQVQLHTFDFIDYTKTKHGVYDVSQVDRRVDLAARVEAINDSSIVLMGQELVPTSEIEERLVVALDQGWEGIMIKDPEAPYVCGHRSDAWLKVKPRHTVEGRIVDFQPGQDSFTGTLGALVLQGVGEAEGLTWKVGTGFLLDDTKERGRHWFWRNREKLRGRVVECFCQTEKRKVASIRFPVFYRLRPDR
jgi:ATP-dependent DNA ligase